MPAADSAVQKAGRLRSAPRVIYSQWADPREEP